VWWIFQGHKDSILIISIACLCSKTLQTDMQLPDSHCLAFRRHTWPTTAALSPMLVSGGCITQRAKHVSWRWHTAPLATEHSRLLDLDYGTSHLKDADLSYNEFRRSLKTFLFGQWGHGAVWTVLTAPTRNIRTYLLTYLLNYLTICQSWYSTILSHFGSPIILVFSELKGHHEILTELLWVQLLNTDET